MIPLYIAYWDWYKQFYPVRNHKYVKKLNF